MNFIADLHVHSKYSIATAKNLDLEHLYMAAQIKGINVVGTGDFTHPAWFNEIETKLQPAENGLYKLNEDLAVHCDTHVPPSCRRPVRFILESEISNIYKKNKKTRKNHNLIFMPNRRAAKKFNARLDRIGNIKADGRPILGLDARNLLEIMLEVSDAAFLIPAHIWTPWFSVLGSKSGFDSLKECYDDLTDQIFAVETGLSSDPAMNWRISGLDGLTLVSNSDAHSPLKLGREANRFNCELAFPAIKKALKSGDPNAFLGTYEYYPEEGKYHLDGHRKCNVRLWPDETIERKGICPVCKKPLTLGVLYRVEELADRPPGAGPQQRHAFGSMIPLNDILSELLQKGPQTKTVQRTYNHLLDEFGPEFDILHNHDPETLTHAELPFLGEAIRRMRRKEITVNPGYDGEFGKIKIFKPGEREQLGGQKSLFKIQAPQVKKKRKKRVSKTQVLSGDQPDESPRRANHQKSGRPTVALNTAQRQAVEHQEGPLLIIAGPGTGKTRTLTHRIAYLIKQRRVPAENILAVTFTHKAAQEMQARLQKLIGPRQPLPMATTLHSFGLKLLTEANTFPPMTIIDDVEQAYFIQEAANTVRGRQGTPLDLTTRRLKTRIMRLKQSLCGPEDAWPDVRNDAQEARIKDVYAEYQLLLERHRCWDYEDLIFNSVKLLESDPAVGKKYQKTYPYVFIDEYQDLNQGQYRMIKALAPQGRGLCAIGDPNQAIYGFRGSDVTYFNQFLTDFPGASRIHLTRNYRSTRTILAASNQVIQNAFTNRSAVKTYSQIDGQQTIHVLKSPSAKAEAVAVGKVIEQLVGGSGFHAIDFGKVDGNAPADMFAFKDFAVLYRTRAQGETIAPVLEKAGIPYQIASRRIRYHETLLGGLLSLLKVVQETGSYLDFKNLLRWMGAGIGDKTWKRFKSWGDTNAYDLSQALHHARRLPIPEIQRAQQSKLNALITRLHQLRGDSVALTGAAKVRYLLEASNLHKHPKTDPAFEDGLQHLLDAAERFGSQAENTLTHLSLQSDTDLYDSQSEKVALMTLHAAKGLEFPVVFIVGCEDDYLPLRRTDAAPVDLEEERRLFYVAMTRAREQLFLSWAQSRRIYGKNNARSLSPFVVDIENRLKTQTGIRSGKRRPAGQTQLELF